MSYSLQSNEKSLLVQETDKKNFEFTNQKELPSNLNQKENILKVEQGIAIPNNSDYITNIVY